MVEENQKSKSANNKRLAIKPLGRNHLSFLNVEITGLNPHFRDRVCEIAFPSKTDIEEDDRDDLMRRIRQILMAAADQLFRQNPTIQFVLAGEIERALAIEIKLRDQYIELTPIFGNRLKQEDVDWVWAPFNL